MYVTNITNVDNNTKRTKISNFLYKKTVTKFARLIIASKSLWITVSVT